MFNSSRSESQPRRASVYGVNKRASSSKFSLLSSITSQSKKSTGSSSTITQESYSRSERRSKRRSNHSTKNRSTRRTSSGMQAEKRPRRSRQSSASDLDVFSYLVEDIEDPSGKSTSWESERRRISKRASVQDDPDEIETKSVRSRLSDSGVSINDSGYDSTSPTSYMKPRLGSLPENVFVENYEHLQRQRSEQRPNPAQIPQPVPQGHMQAPYPYHYEYGPPPPNQQICPSSDEQHNNAISSSNPPLSGYDLLASLLSNGNQKPSSLPSIYRRFATLNHRLLLQLQDEISEMETELRRLDDIDTYTRQNLPATRRTDWGSGRLDLLSKIHMKLEHYHSAVLSMQKIKLATSHARSNDVETYRSWLVENRPLQGPEMSFLDDDADLISLDIFPHTPSAESPTPPPYKFPLLSSLAGVWLVTCVPSILSRWTFLFLLAAFTIGTQPTTLSSFEWTEAWTRVRALALPLAFWTIITAIC